MQEVQPGLWRWEAPHPDWEPAADWQEVVASYAIEVGERLIVFDPIAPAAELERLASGREVAVVLTCPWHVRDAVELAGRLGAEVHVPPPDDGDPDPVEGTVYRVGDRVAGVAQAFPGMETNDLVLWIESHHALVIGDTLIDRGSGLEFPVDWVKDPIPPAQVIDSLRPLLELPVETVLPTHGAPAGRATLEQILA